MHIYSPFLISNDILYAKPKIYYSQNDWGKNKTEAQILSRLQYFKIIMYALVPMYLFGAASLAPSA